MTICSVYQLLLYMNSKLPSRTVLDLCVFVFMKVGPMMNYRCLEGMLTSCPLFAEFRQHVLYLVGVLGLCLVFYLAYVTLLCLEPPEVRHKMAFGRSAPPSPHSPSLEHSPLLKEVVSDEGLDVTVTIPSEDEETWVPLTPAKSPARRSAVALEEGPNPELDEIEHFRRYLLP